MRPLFSNPFVRSVPAILGVIVLLVSLVLDVTGTLGQEYWSQRSGAVLTIIGAMIAFHDAKESFKVVGTILYTNSELPYKRISLLFIIVGTFLWGYGDLLFKYNV